MPSNVQILNWDDALKEISTAGCNKLHTALSHMRFTKNERSRLRFYVVTYNYGDTIACDGKLEPSTIHGADKAGLLSAVNYADIPLGLALDKTVEVNSVLSFDDKVECVPTTLIRKGELFGVFETLNTMLDVTRGKRLLVKANSWNVTAGAQSVVINFPCTKFKNSKSSPDWEAVKKIAADTHVEWKCRILFFPSELITNKSRAEHIKPLVFHTGWMQVQLVLTYNSIFDNALDDLASACKSNAKGDLSPIFFWFFVRLFLTASNVRPGYVLVNKDGPDSCGPFPEVLSFFEKNKNGSKTKTTPMIFEPCFLRDSKKGVYCSAFQATVVDRIGRKADRNLNTFVVTPIISIFCNLNSRGIPLQWFAHILELKTRNGNVDIDPHLYEIRDVLRRSRNDEAMTEILNPHDGQFAKVLVRVVN